MRVIVLQSGINHVAACGTIVLVLMLVGETVDCFGLIRATPKELVLLIALGILMTAICSWLPRNVILLEGENLTLLSLGTFRGLKVRTCTGFTVSERRTKAGTTVSFLDSEGRQLISENVVPGSDIENWLKSRALE
jgi:hypothetical protein